MRGNLGATILSPPCGPVKGTGNVEIALVENPKDVPVTGAEVVHKVATKFIEGITPIAVRAVSEHVEKVHRVGKDEPGAPEDVSSGVKAVPVEIFETPF